MRDHSLVARLSNLVIFIGIGFCSLASMYAVYLGYFHDTVALSQTRTSVYWFYFVGGLFAALALASCLRLSTEIRVNLVLIFVSTTVGLLCAELYLNVSKRTEIQTLREYRKTIADQNGIKFDKRSKTEFISEQRHKGKYVYPNIFPTLFIQSNGLETVDGRLFPLGGRSNVTTLGDNELGFYPLIEADEHGFANPKGLYKKGAVDLLMIGDSFVEQNTVAFEDTIAEKFRRAGVSTLNLGKSSNGPLIELATLQEYGPALTPRVVLWIFNPNDLDVVEEAQSQILRQYLEDPTFSQGLVERQDEVDRLLTSWLLKLEAQQNIRAESQLNIMSSLYSKLINSRFWLLPEVSSLISIKPLCDIKCRIMSSYASSSDMKLFQKIIQRAQSVTKQWGGEMYFVYLPAFMTVSSGIRHPDHQTVLDYVKSLGIPVLDTYAHVIKRHPDPLSLFPFRANGHFSADGYHVIFNGIYMWLGKRLH